MATFATIQTRVAKLVADHTMITTSDIQTIIQTEHDTILEDYSWSRRKTETTLTTLALYTTGTITTTGAAVVGSGTAWDQTFVGRWMRSGSQTAYLKITAVADATHLTLEASLQSDLTAATYSIFQNVYTLPSDFSRVLELHGRTRLMDVARMEIDSLDPYRSGTVSDSTHYNMRGITSTGLYELELWPVPNAIRVYRLQYLRTNTLVDAADSPIYRSTILIWKAAESCAFFLHARTGDLAWLQLADRYHQRYLEDFQGAKEDDLGKFSPLGHVKDAYESGLGSDYFIDKDPLRLL